MTAGRRWAREAQNRLTEEQQDLDPAGQPGVKQKVDHDAGLNFTCLKPSLCFPSMHLTGGFASSAGRDHCRDYSKTVTTRRSADPTQTRGAVTDSANYLNFSCPFSEHYHFGQHNDVHFFAINLKSTKKQQRTSFRPIQAKGLMEYLALFLLLACSVF